MIITYDVEQRRTERFRKLLAEYLEHEQNSVFIGTIKPSARKRLLTRLKRLIRPGERVTEVLAENRNNVEVTRLEKEASTGPVREAESRRHLADHRVI